MEAKNDKNDKMNYIATGSSIHSYRDSEAINIGRFINSIFTDDKKETAVLKKFNIIPIDVSKPENLFPAFKNGILFNYLINVAKPGTIDDFSVNKMDKLLIYHIAQNLQLAIHSARSIGCKVIGINPSLITGPNSESLILGMTWQIVRIIALQKCSIRETPLLSVVLTGKETNDEIAKLTGEQLLVKWLNYHLLKSAYKKEVKVIGADLMDGIAIAYLMHELDKSFDLAIVNASDKKERYEAILKFLFDVIKLPRMFDISIFSSPELILLLIANIFQIRNGLVQVDEKVAVSNIIKLMDGQLETNEERSYREWINSLFPDGEVYIEPDRLIDSLKDGLVLIKVIEKINPALVDKSKYIKDPGTNRLKMVNNCRYAIELIKKMPNVIVLNIDGLNIVDGKKDLICGFLWQLVANHYMKMLGSIKEEDIISWANKKVGKEPLIKDFKDPNLKDGKFILRIIDQMQKDAVDWSHVKEGTVIADIKDNTKYLLSCARKINAPIFMNVDDIITLNPKIIIILLATLMLLDKSLSK